MEIIIGIFILSIVVGVISGLAQPAKKRRRKRKTTSTKKKPVSVSKNTTHKRRYSKTCRTDDIILTRPLNDLNGFEFERLLALYFRDKGYIVHEVGVGGNDGGVDLVIIDNRGEKTAVQAKCYADHNLVPVQTVRELVGAKRNHDCMLSKIITTSDLTVPAKKEAEKFRVEYWHGGIIEHKLRTWGRWVPAKR